MARILIGNIKGPVGDKGDKGDQGPVGPQGPAGAKGEKGDMPALVKELTATEEGVAALDAVVGKILNDKITQLNSDLAPQYKSFSTSDFSSSAANTDSCYAIRTGNTVFLKLTVMFNQDVTSGKTWIQLPSQYRPKYTVKLIGGVYNAAGITVGAIKITTDGVVTCDQNVLGEKWNFFYASYCAA